MVFSTNRAATLIKSLEGSAIKGSQFHDYTLLCYFSRLSKRPSCLKKIFSTRTGMAIVIANMVGTGVFTSLGFQLQSIQAGFVLLMLWVVGGITAICGALSYAEIGAALPRSGGEYNFLSRIIHPAAGFTSGWISSTIGFSAPVALTAMTFGAYITAIIGVDSGGWAARIVACLLVIVLMLIHAGRREGSSALQGLFTLLKIVVIIGFCLIALIVTKDYQPVSLLPKEGDSSLLFSGAFAISLIYVSYAYTGWNAATYLSGELQHPQSELPKILFVGTFTVMLLYALLNATFLLTTPIAAMEGKIEIGFIAASHIFGPIGAKFTGLVLAALLISTVSAMTIAGPRVLQVIGEDFKLFSPLARTNQDGIPSLAIKIQSAISIVFILTSTFKSVLIFAGFALALNSFITVVGLFVLRIREPELERPFKVPLYPVTPIIYLLLNGWTLLYVLKTKPFEAYSALALIAVGLVLYTITKNKN